MELDGFARCRRGCYARGEWRMVRDQPATGERCDMQTRADALTPRV